MSRFLLGVLVGAVATAVCMRRQSGQAATGRADELSAAAHNIVADPAVNAGDGTPGHSTARTDNLRAGI